MVETKHLLRDHLRQQRRAHTALLDANDYCEALRQHLDDLVPPHTTIAGYWPHGSELDCRPLLQHLHQLGHRLCLPRVIADTKILIFHAWQPNDCLEKDSMGILAPLATSQKVHPGIVLTPLLGFDHFGNRLGQGQGYYDATLAQHSCIAVGLAFECQFVETLATEVTDHPLDYVLTPTKLYDFSKN